MPAESREHPGFHYRMKTQEGGSLDCGLWALRITSDMAGFSFTNGVKRRRILPVATGNKYCGMVILFDVERIEPVAIMPDGVIQKVRVAAMSAVGARYLAPNSPKVLGLFGSGWQASSHIEFLCAQYNFDEVKVYSPNQEHCREFARAMTEKLGQPIRAVATPKEAVDGSDFIQAETAAWDPVFDGHWVEKGMYICSIGGSDARNKRREIDDECIRRFDIYFVHSKEVARNDQSPDVWEAAQKGIKRWEDRRVAGSGRRQTRGPHKGGSDHAVQQQYRCRNAVRGGRRGSLEARPCDGAWPRASNGMVLGERLAVINQHRRAQLMDLMVERGWDRILLCGHAWRKEFFRCLVNFNYYGPHAAVSLTRFGDLRVRRHPPLGCLRWECTLRAGV